MPGKESPKRTRDGVLKQTTLDGHAARARSTGKQGKQGARTNRGLFGGSTAAAEQEQQPAVKDKKQLRRSGRTSAAPKEATPAPSKAAAKQKQQHKHAAASPSKQRAGKAKQQPASGVKAGKGAGSGAKPRRRVLPCVERDDGEEVLRVGDSVYVVLDESCLALLSDEEDMDDYACLGCGDTEKEERVMLECGRCLGGWHLDCLDPPLSDVPEDNWLCPDCAAGKPPPKRAASSSRDLFLQQAGLGLGRVEALWEEGGTQQALVRWYEVPEQLHCGRQKHHAAREVFLTQQRDEVEVEALGRAVRVLPPAQFYKGEGGSGDDVFLCEYEYDTVWQRFKRITQFDSDGSEDEWCPSDGDEADEEDRDRTFKPIYAFWAEKGLIPAKNMRGGINRRKKKQGGEAFLDAVGATEIPEHVAVRRGRGQASGVSTALAQARDMLTLTYMPKRLPCRADERRAVERFVTEVLDDTDETGCGKCLYVSGIPGTGKTATVKEVMRGFKQRAEEGEVPPFKFVEINGLRLPSPQHAYSALYEALTGDRVGPQHAAQLLDNMMSGSGSGGKKGGEGCCRRPTIVLVDEMDLLVNKTQTVLYNLFEWPGRKGSRFSIIGIANTMDLPERLHPRIGSRLAGRREVFHPYRTEQLMEIIKSRLEGMEAFDSNAITLVSRKVANCSGDVRRCLELCRRAAEIAEECYLRQQKEQQQAGSSSGGSGSSSTGAAAGGSSQRQETGRVEMRHVNAAVQEMFNTSHAVMVRTASRLERMLLAAMHLESRFSGRTEALLEDVADRLRQLCANNGEQQYEFGAVLEGAVRLGSKRLILCDPGSKRLKMKMSINVPLNDLLHVLRQDEQIPWLEKLLAA